MISDIVSDPLSPGTRDRAKVLRLTENPVQEQISGGITQTPIEGINCHQILFKHVWPESKAPDSTLVLQIW